MSATPRPPKPRSRPRTARSSPTPSSRWARGPGHRRTRRRACRSPLRQLTAPGHPGRPVRHRRDSRRRVHPFGGAGGRPGGVAVPDRRGRTGRRRGRRRGGARPGRTGRPGTGERPARSRAGVQLTARQLTCSCSFQVCWAATPSSAWLSSWSRGTMATRQRVLARMVTCCLLSGARIAGSKIAPGPASMAGRPSTSMTSSPSSSSRTSPGDTSRSARMAPAGSSYWR